MASVKQQLQATEMPTFLPSQSGKSHSILDWVQGDYLPSPDQYFRDIASLELLWRQIVPNVALRVVHDEPEQLPGAATRTAMAVLVQLEQSPGAREWFANHVRNAIVHCSSGADAIAFVGDSVHFFQAKAGDHGLGKQIFDRLAGTQQQDFAALFPGRDPREEFGAFIDSIFTTPVDEARVREHYERISQWLGSGRYSLVLTGAIEAEPPRGANGDGMDGQWSDELNQRRIELIDKEIQGEIAAEELVELRDLQRRAIAYRDRVAPLPIEGARRLHAQLLERKRQRESNGG